MSEASTASPSPEPSPDGGASAVVEAPVVAETALAAEVAAPAESAVVETAAETPAEEAAEVPAEAAAEEAPVVEGPKPETEAAAESEPATPEIRTYEDWKLPEGMTLQTDQVGALNNILGKYGLTQEAGQEIIDYGSGILRQAQERMDERQREVFEETNAKWVADFKKDAGNRYGTLLNDAKAAITAAVPNEKQRAEVWSALAATGAGNHPAVIRAFASLGKRLREPSSPSPGLPANRDTRSAAERRYGSTPKN